VGRAKNALGHLTMECLTSLVLVFIAGQKGKEKRRDSVVG